MSNSTLTYWEVDGVSLQTYAWDIETIGGDRLAPPKLRGKDLVIPGQAGERWMPKQVDARTITLGMWVIGTEEDGSAPTGSLYRQWDDNFRKLRQLLWTPGRQFTLTKRFYVDGVLKTASAKAQFASGIIPSMNGRARGVFSVDLQLADPYFYSAERVINLSTGSQTVEVEGDAVTRNIKIHVDGPRLNPKIRNSTMGVEVEYHADLSSGDDLDIDVRAYSSVTDPGTGPAFNSIGSIRHTGDPNWLLLQPGDNTVVVSSDTGIGSVQLTIQEAWL